MSNNTHSNEPMTDDPELAKVLEGMNQQTVTSADAAATDQSIAGLQFEETQDNNQADQNAQLPTPQPSDQSLADIPMPPLPDPAMLDEAPSAPTPPTSHQKSETHGSTQASPELESIKKDALEELRPLVDKLDLPADEKFDTLLLIIRSTDDQALLGAAHTAAKAIEDDSKRAQALLDVIKEIDFFAHQT